MWLPQLWIEAFVVAILIAQKTTEFVAQDAILRDASEILA
jgi:hypothetical protein